MQEHDQWKKLSEQRTQQGLKKDEKGGWKCVWNMAIECVAIQLSETH